MELYRAGKYRAAIARFKDAYRNVSSPKLIYNVARSYEALGESDEAVRDYLRCASDAKASEALKQKAIRRVRIIERARRRSAAAPRDAAPSAETLQLTRTESGPSFVGTSKWVTAGLSLALVGGGATLLHLGLADESELDDARTVSGQVSSLTRTQAQALADQSESRKLTGTIVLGAGVAMAVTSLILFLVDGDEEQTTVDGGASDTVSFTATPMPDGGAVGFLAEF